MKLQSDRQTEATENESYTPPSRGCVITRDVKVSRPTWSRDHFFGLGLTVIGLCLGLGLMRYWSLVSHTDLHILC